MFDRRNYEIFIDKSLVKRGNGTRSRRTGGGGGGAGGS